MNPLESFGFITEDTRIVLMDPFGKIIYTTASYFESRGLNGPKFPKLKILSKNGKFTNLTNVRVFIDGSRINVIRASHGTIKVTDNCIIPIYRNREYMEIPAKDVKTNDCLVESSLKNIVREEDKLQEINLIDMIPFHSNISVVSTPKLVKLIADIAPNISEENKIKIAAGKLISLDYYKLIRNKLGDVIDENELNLTVQTKYRPMKPIPAKYKLTKEFGRFYGLFYSEGYIHHDKEIIITNSDPEIIDFAKAYLAELLHRDKATVGVVNGCSKISLCSSLFTPLFGNDILGHHNGSGDLKLPEWFFFANDDFLKGFLSGVIDGDGCINISHNYTEIYTSSETFAEDIQAICSRLGYIVSVRVEKTKGKINHINGKISTCNFDQYVITIGNPDIVDMNLHDSIKARKLHGYIDERTRRRNRTYDNRVSHIDSYDFNGYVYQIETADHYFAAGTQLLHD